MEISASLMSALIGFRAQIAWFGLIPHAILAAQTIFLIPTLLERARQIVEEDKQLGSSRVHVLYVVAEGAKVLALFGAGVYFIFNPVAAV
jgi:hypothetical protein